MKTEFGGQEWHVRFCYIHENLHGTVEAVLFWCIVILAVIFIALMQS